jgi:hypothetical protein
MGLDQFAFAVSSNGSKEEIAYWRKHPNLQGWMEDLWVSKGSPNAHENSPNEFNCVPVELTHEDLESLENAITNNEMPSTTGFFFGSDSDDHYKEQDLEFVRKAREALDSGLTVMYDSWW